MHDIVHLRYHAIIKEIPTTSGASGGVYIILGCVLAVVALIFGVVAIIITVLIVLIKKGMYITSCHNIIILDGTNFEPLLILITGILHPKRVNSTSPPP